MVANRTLIGEDLRKELAALYRQPERHYHGLAHIEALLALQDEHRSEFSDPEAVEAAIWFHDAVYDSRRSDNEAQSAVLAAQRLAGGTDSDRLARIVGMIEATATHAPPSPTDGSASRDTALFLDMDLAILGALPALFDIYEAAVRREYAWVDEDAWRKGRAAVLKAFLDRPSIFHTQIFRQRYEQQARQNIERSLGKIAAQSEDKEIEH